MRFHNINNHSTLLVHQIRRRRPVQQLCLVAIDPILDIHPLVSLSFFWRLRRLFSQGLSTGFAVGVEVWLLRYGDDTPAVARAHGVRGGGVVDASIIPDCYDLSL